VRLWNSDFNDSAYVIPSQKKNMVVEQVAVKLDIQDTDMRPQFITSSAQSNAQVKLGATKL
jgi:hypothetical protein